MRSKRHSSVTTSLALGCLLALAACRPAAVRPERSTTATGLPRPERVAVLDFTVDAAAVKEDSAIGSKVVRAFSDTSEAEREAELGRKVAEALSADLVDGIRELGLPADRASRSEPLPPGTLIVDGRFVGIDEGNRLRRLVIGFSAGQSTVETQVVVDLLTQRGRERLLQFEATAKSAPMPGAAVTMGAGAAAQGAQAVAVAAGTGALKESRSTVESDAGAGASQIVAYLSEFFARQGWIPQDKVRSPRVAAR
jgi:hypothetical protein